jgi:signal transduction histidine kinase
LIDPDEALAQVVDQRGAVLDATSGVSDIDLVSMDDLSKAPTFVDRAIPSLEPEDLYRLLIVPVEGGEAFVVVGATLSDRQEALDQLLLLMGIGGPIALALSSLAGWVLAGAALRPVERMRQEAVAISVSEPDRRLPVPSGDDELARLGTTLNAMLDRLQTSFDRERRFVDEASHELRTPLAVLKAELDLALARERTPEELTASLRAASSETDRLVRLAEDLLVLARADGGSLPIRRADVSVGDLLRTTASAWEPRAVAAGVRLHVEADEGTFSMDPTRIRQALDNLIDNALRHGPATNVGLRGVLDGGLTLVVEDDGAGFGGTAVEAFEPFTSNGSGESGLGLAVVRAVAEAHGGSADAENVAAGAVVSIRLPAR